MTKQLNSKKFDQMLAEFSELSTKRTKPERWRIFFEKNPYALSPMLSFSVRSEAIKPVADDAENHDMILYAHRGEDQMRFGILELTWQYDEPKTSYSRKTLRLLPDIEVSLDQYRDYIIEEKATLVHADRSVVCIGCGVNVFLIAGMDNNMCDAFVREASQSQTLPQGVELLSYGAVAELFLAKAPPQILIIYPTASTGEGDTADILGKLRMTFKEEDWEGFQCG